MFERLATKLDSPAAKRLRVCMLCSGAAGLIYEVVWIRLLALVMGQTVYALSAVLTAFLGGLALGSHFAGRWTQDRRGTLRLYAKLEVGVGIFGLAMPWLIEGCSPLFGALYRSLGGSFLAYNLGEFAICSALLLVPTILMGATLPIVVSVMVDSRREFTSSSARLYAWNTFGGALGAAMAGFWAIPNLGLIGTCVFAATLNAVAAGLSWKLSESLGAVRAEATTRNDVPVQKGEPSQSGVTLKGDDPQQAASSASVIARGDWLPPAFSAILLIYGLAGFASLALQVAWVRVVSLAIGSTTYAFTITLVTFIIGLGSGSALVGRFDFLRNTPVRTMFWLNGIIGVWTLLILGFLGSLSIRIYQICGALGFEFSRLIWAEIALVGSTILLPTLCMGGMFPLASSIIERTGRSAGDAVGRAYSANTLGNILGSFVAGFILIPVIGMQTTIIVAASLSLAAAFTLAVPSLRRGELLPRVHLGLLGVGLVMGIFFAIPRWDPIHLTSGPYGGAVHLLKMTGNDTSWDRLNSAMADFVGPLLDYEEGPTAVVTVHGQGEQLAMRVGGYTEAVRFGGMQTFLGQIPLIIHGDAKDVLVIGLGSGSTLASALDHSIEHVDVVEISGEVVRAHQKHFAPLLKKPLEDQRVNLILGDGRNHLRHSDQKYDVVISQPSMPWTSGAANLFTKEAFSEIRNKLKEGGVACNWFQSYAENQEDLKSLLKTWSAVFETAYMFESPVPGAYLLIGMSRKETLSVEGMELGFQRQKVLPHFQRMGINRISDLIGHLVMDRGAMIRLGEEVPMNTDDNAFIEHTAARGILLTAPWEVIALVDRHRMPIAKFFVNESRSPPLNEPLNP